MRIVICQYVFDFHKNYYKNIITELKKRDHEVIIAEKGKNYNADFTLQCDEIYPNHGSKHSIFINHAIAVIPQNGFFIGDKFKHDVMKRSNHIFTTSKEWESFWSAHFNNKLLVYNTGYPYLDKLFNNLDPADTVVFAPTHRQKTGVSHNYNIIEIESYCKKLGYKFHHRQHPAFDKSNIGYEDTFKRASIIISDYSSFGIESIVLNIPTILFGNEQWKDIKSITSICDEAAQRVYSIDDFKVSLNKYKENPKFQESERIKQGKRMCDYQGTASKVVVDTMENLL